jgi:hypothetical protein
MFAFTTRSLELDVSLESPFDSTQLLLVFEEVKHRSQTSAAR